MLWELIVTRYSAEILSALILLGATFFAYKLLKEDDGAAWNFILIAVSFLAISAVFDVIEEFFVITLFYMLKNIFMILSSIVFVCVLSSALINDNNNRLKK